MENYWRNLCISLTSTMMIRVGKNAGVLFTTKEQREIALFVTMNGCLLDRLKWKLLSTVDFISCDGIEMSAKDFRLFIYRHWRCLSANKTSNEIHSPSMIDWAMSAHMDRSRHSESQQKLLRNSSKTETRCFKIRIRKLMAHKKRNEGGTFFCTFSSILYLKLSISHSFFYVVWSKAKWFWWA